MCESAALLTAAGISQEESDPVRKGTEFLWLTLEPPVHTQHSLGWSTGTLCASKQTHTRFRRASDLKQSHRDTRITGRERSALPSWCFIRDDVRDDGMEWNCLVSLFSSVMADSWSAEELTLKHLFWTLILRVIVHMQTSLSLSILLCKCHFNGHRVLRKHQTLCKSQVGQPDKRNVSFYNPYSLLNDSGLQACRYTHG